MIAEKSKISRYYKETKHDYKLFWHTDRTLSTHYGYHSHAGIPHDEAVTEMVRQVALFGGITKDDIVLDAGCGLGGSAIWLAENIGCRVVGIDLADSRIETARLHAVPGTIFFTGDFCETLLPSSSFTVVFALESSCHAPDKLKFVREAFRLLDWGGRLVVADGFGTKPDMEILQGWGVPNLAGIHQFMEYMSQTGFTGIKLRDITANVMPSSRRMYMAALSVYPIHKLLGALGARTKAQYDNVETAVGQYKLLKNREFRYCMFLGKKSHA